MGLPNHNKTHAIVCDFCGHPVLIGQRGRFAAFCVHCLAFRMFDELSSRPIAEVDPFDLTEDDTLVFTTGFPS